MQFPRANLIIDLFHTHRYVSDLYKILLNQDEKKVAQNRICFWSLLDEGMTGIIVQRACKKLPQNSDAKKKAEQGDRLFTKYKE